MRKYPRYEGARQLKVWQCQVCKATATHRVDIQYGYSRSDDESYTLCQKHKNLAKSNPAQLVDELRKARTEQEARNDG